MWLKIWLTIEFSYIQVFIQPVFLSRVIPAWAGFPERKRFGIIEHIFTAFISPNHSVLSKHIDTQSTDASQWNSPTELDPPGDLWGRDPMPMTSSIYQVVNGSGPVYVTESAVHASSSDFMVPWSVGASITAYLLSPISLKQYT